MEVNYLLAQQYSELRELYNQKLSLLIEIDRYMNLLLDPCRLPLDNPVNESQSKLNTVMQNIAMKEESVKTFKQF
jgi:hypothetical protein